ncbi:MAG: TIGR01212 family radical SAM protein [Ruminococcaceae bacterium]|nr:TIGR01212 family radical SAM protein [Oscillospiraceae bacterium]
MNPYKNTDSNKRYFTYDYYLRKTFGGKCLKIPLDIGCTCPNIDGSRGKGGCIYCSSRGSGDFASAPTLSIAEQCKRGTEALSKKWNVDRIIPYFQAHTNTYADVEFLKKKYTEALRLDNVVAMNIATRADCISEEIAELLCEIADQTVLTVELGLQSTNDRTAALINRCHTYKEFLTGYKLLRTASDKIRIGVHIIDGLPGENEDDMMQTARDVASLYPEEVKIHLLHVIKGTKLAELYENGEYIPLELDAYARIVANQLTLMPPETVIGRITGDGVQSELLAPLWSLKKTNVINSIDKFMYAENLWQGKNY